MKTLIRTAALVIVLGVAFLTAPSKSTPGSASFGNCPFGGICSYTCAPCWSDDDCRIGGLNQYCMCDANCP